MDGPRDYNTKWSKSDRQTQILYNLSYMWNVKNNTNTHTHTHKQRSETDEGD